MATPSLTILIAEESANRAERYQSALRNAGMNVSVHCVGDWASFEETLDGDPVDLVLVNPATFAPLTTDTAIHRASGLSRYPVIAVCACTDEAAAELYSAGCVAIVDPDATEELVATVKRESASIELRRQVDSLVHQLEETEDRCSALVETSRDAIAYVHEGMHVRTNSVYLDMFGYDSFSEIETVPLMDLVTPSDQRRFKDFLRKFERNDTGKADLQLRARNLASDEFDVDMEFVPARVDREPCTQIIIRDSGANSQELLDRIETLSNQDLASGLFNRHHFLRELGTLCDGEGCGDKEMAVAYIAIDQFDDIRSANGIDISDALVRELAEVTLSQLREGDLLARFSDSTLALLLKRDEQYEIETLAEDIRGVIKEHLFECAGQVSSLTCTIGLAFAPADIHQTNAGELATQAHRAVKEAQSDGQDRVHRFDPVLDTESLADDGERSLAESIRHALQHDRLKLVFQPMVSLQGDAKEHFACLMQLSDNDNQPVSNTALQSAAQASGQQIDIDRWVVRNAIRTVSELRREGRRVVFFVSLSSASLADDGTLMWICDYLRESKAKASWLVFQIKDSEIRRHLQPSRKLITGLTKLRGRIALDGFGIESNAGKILKHLPIDFACIDASFTENLAGSEEHQEALGELNRLAQGYKVKTIARSVEDANSLAVLWTVGVDYIQSYFLQEPNEALNYDFGS